MKNQVFKQIKKHNHSKEVYHNKEGCRIIAQIIANQLRDCLPKKDSPE